MTVNQSIRLAVRRTLAMGAIAALGAGSLAALAAGSGSDAAQQSATAPQSVTTQPASASARRVGKKTAKQPILLAQTTPPPPGGNSAAAAPVQLQTIVVTGSMIARPQAETAEAITVVSANSLQNMGIPTVEQAVQQLTANESTNITASSVSTWGLGGGSFASLRDLGASKTLVLLDGHRLADDVVTGNSVDINGIPYAAIERVEVLREGASSLYGSDAIGGVINFITKKDYQGADLDLELNQPQHAGGGSDEANLSFGHGDLLADGYNFMIAASYNETRELRAEQRAFSATGFDPSAGLTNQNGPMGTWPASYTDGKGNIWQVGYPACSGNPLLTEYYGDCAYEYSAAVDLIPKSSELSGLASFTKELPANNTLALQYFYTQSRVTTWGGPQTYSFEMTPQADPAYFPTAAESTCYATCTTGTPDLTDPITVGWTDVTNNRYQRDVNSEQRVLLTFAGDNGGWDYTTSLNYSRNTNVVTVLGGYANYAVLAPNSILSNLINPFGAYSSAAQSLINSAYLNGNLGSGALQHYSVSGHASHKLGDAFGAGRAAELAIGFQAGYESIDFASTPLAATLYTATYYPPSTVQGSRSFEAIFTELDVPVTRHTDLTLSDREDRYSDFGETNNGKIAFRYQPFRMLTFRGAASTGFRAPSLFELYQPDIFGADAGSMNGPGCASGNYNTIFSFANCNAQGMSLVGGNTRLQPETSENFDFGVAIEPLRNLGITVDYYRILVKNEIQEIPDQVIYGNPTGFANLYVLNSAGTFTQAPEANTQCPTYAAPTCGYIIQTQQNTGGITTDGFDLSVQYSRRTAIGMFRADLEGTAITHFRLQEYTGGPQLDLLGWMNGGNQPAIRWQHLLTIDWTNGRWGAGLSNHFLSSYIDEYLTAADEERKVGSDSLWNVYASFKPISPLTVLFGVRNVLDRNPPFSNQNANWQAGYNPVFSDPLLRTFYLNLKYRF
jgi:iron complex outermembrane recepter protein